MQIRSFRAVTKFHQELRGAKEEIRSFRAFHKTRPRPETFSFVAAPVRSAKDLGSPYAWAGYVSHVTHDFGSILKFTEEDFHLPSWDTRTRELTISPIVLTWSRLRFHFKPFRRNLMPGSSSKTRGRRCLLTTNNSKPLGREPAESQAAATQPAQRHHAHKAKSTARAVPFAFSN